MTRDLTQGKPLRLILSFSLSVLVSGIISYLYSTVDSVMVGRFVSPDALGAISNASQIIIIIQSLLTCILDGAGILTGMIFGSGDYQKLRNALANTIYVAVFCALCLPVLALTLGRPLLNLINVPPELMEMAYDYLLTEFCCSFTCIAPWVFDGVFRSLGDNRTSLIVALISGALNVVFDYIFIYLCNLGVVGAALGTAAARLAPWGIYFYVFAKKTPLLHFGRKDAHVSFKVLKKLVFLGLPIGLQTSITSVGSSILQRAINGQGTDVVNGVSTGNRVFGFVWTALNAFAVALTYYCAQNCGAKRPDRIRVGVRKTLWTAIGVTGAMSAIMLVFGRYIFMLFVGNEEAIIVNAQMFTICQLAFFPMLTILFLFRASVQGLGFTAASLGCGIIELVVRIIISVFFSDNVIILYLAGPAAWIGTSVFLLIMYRRILKKLDREAAEEKSAPAPEEVPV